jgi:hypothetical protein
MAENKTRATAVKPADFIAGLDHPTRRADAEVVVRMMAEVSGEPPVMWGPTMIGFGRYRYTYESGRSGEIFRIGFSPRKPHLVFYCGCARKAELAGRLGKAKSDGGCIYVNKLADVDLGVLRELFQASLEESLERHPESAVPA